MKYRSGVQNTLTTRKTTARLQTVGIFFREKREMDFKVSATVNNQM